MHNESPNVPGNARPRAKFLTAVWGEAYIRRFATLSLPSFVAPGNLPALAGSTDLEVVIMTRRDDAAYFESHVAFRRLRTICPVRFVEIDDLVTTGVYGVTLTLAYARPVIACGSEMLNTHFVFMNADFVLADGSLRSLARHILAGRSIVLGPSFRATAEAVEPHLEAAVDEASGVLAMPPRQLAALSLPHPHPTTIAKIVNQGFCHSTHPNQFFWQVDDETLLGRYYLIFMLCLRPERIVTSVNCFCDYSFIPEMCPSGDEVAMDDSDDFFMLELQRREQETHLLRIGRQTEDQIARSLSQWTTAEHRRAASHDIVFHLGDVPPGVEAVRAEAQAFVTRIGRKLGPSVSHKTHRYWIRGVEAWRRFRKAQKLPAAPPELARPASTERLAARVLRDPASAAMQTLWNLGYAVERKLVGRWPTVTLFHPGWMDSRHLQEALASALAAPAAHVMVVRNDPASIDPLVGAGVPVEFATLREVLGGSLGALRHRPGGFTHALIYLPRKDWRHARQLIERCETLLSPGGVYQLFLHNGRSDADQGIASSEEDLVAHVEELLPSPRWTAECSFVGGLIKRLNQEILAGMYRSYAHRGPRTLFWILPLLGLVLPLTLVANLRFRITGVSRHFVAYCSSVSFRFAPARRDATRACEPSIDASRAESPTGPHSRVRAPTIATPRGGA